MFTLSGNSQQNLVGVHPDVIRVVKRAAQDSNVPFVIGEGVRSAADQLRDWHKGVTKLNGIPVGSTFKGVAGTGVGKHQVTRDGYGHAVDAVPLVGGELLWSLPTAQQWQHIYPMADAIRAAAIAEGVTLRWGGVWDKKLNDLSAGAAALEQEVKAYQARHAGPDFLDGPHFELAGA